MNDRDFHEEMKARHAVLVEQYGRFKKAAAILCGRGSVRFDRDHQMYFIRTGDYFRGSLRDRKAAVMLMKLQTLISEQSMLLLQLEDAIK